MYILFLINFYWSIVALQCCVSFYYTANESAISSVQFSRSVVSDSLWPHGVQHARPPCPSPTPRACSNSCLSSWWCHPSIIVLSHPRLLLSPIFPSIRVFSNESVLWCSAFFLVQLSHPYMTTGKTIAYVYIYPLLPEPLYHCHPPTPIPPL